MLEAYKFPTQEEAEEMDTRCLREEINMAEQQISALQEILDEKEEK